MATNGAVEDMDALRQQALEASAAKRRSNDLTDGLQRIRGLVEAGPDREVLLREIDGLLAKAGSAEATTEHKGPESRLRAAMTSRSASTAELGDAIRGVEALVDEARRELRRMQQNERRAAFEGLYHAIAQNDEAMLEKAIAVARASDVPVDDIEKAEHKLNDLQAMTPEQKLASLEKQFARERKQEAYNLVKKNDPDKLKAVLAKVNEDTWKGWRDYQGRSLFKFARDMKADNVLHYLGPLLGQEVPVLDRGERRTSGSSNQGRPSLQMSAPPSPANVAPTTPVTQAAPSSPAQVEQKTPATPARSMASASPPTRNSISDMSASPKSAMYMTSPRINPDDPMGTSRQRAFRAVVADDVETLEEVLDGVDLDVWKDWKNRAQEDLLDLSLRRPTSRTYSLIANRLGILKEQQRETYEEEETVWVYHPGEVQPMRATVKRDAMAEDDQIIVEYWDGDAAHVAVDRALVRKQAAR